MKSYKKGFEAFVEKARKIHGNKYTYVEESYVKSTKNCTIICPKHGEFYKRPDSHLHYKQGCPVCSSSSFKEHLRWFTTDVEEFIKDKPFTYKPEQDFVFKKTRLKFDCPYHGEFLRSIRNLESGKGCQECDKIVYTENQRLKRESEFLAKAKEIHGDKYSYEGIDYQGAFKSISIYCKTCEEHFLQKPREHLQGNGCQICARNSLGKKLKMTLQKFLKKVEGKYDCIDYSQLSFESIEDIGTFVCTKHGTYTQKVANHLRYKGCLECGKENIPRMTSEEFFGRLKHHDKYDYSKVVYQGLFEEITLACKKHDKEFSTTPSKLLYYPETSEHCPLCRTSCKSYQETSIALFLQEHGYNVIQSYRLGRKEVDIFLPDYALGIEYNGSVTHHSNLVGFKFLDDRVKSCDYHLEKYNLCKENNIELIHIFEFEDIEEWYQKILDYLNNPTGYKITFQNIKRSHYNKRLSGSKIPALDYYGQSFIEPLDI